MDDGRNIDPSVGLLTGEASEQEATGRGQMTEAPAQAWDRVPSGEGDPGAEPTYYDRPVLKEPVWIWAVPAYFYLGGAAGAAGVLAAAAQTFSRDDAVHGLVKRCRWIGAVGTLAGTGLLIHDLGRPDRFLNMLRVFRPTSPLSVGSWILATATPLNGVSALLADADGGLGGVGSATGMASAVMGLPLSGYTAVLLSNTAVPVWQQTRGSLPALFVSSAVSAAASLLQLMRLNDREQRIARRFAAVGAVAELASHLAVEREAGRVEEVAVPLHQGVSGAMLRAAKGLAAASLALTLLPGKARWRSIAAGAFGTAGALAIKFGIFHAGKASSIDPRATFRQQRAGYGAAEVTGRAAVTGPEGGVG
jgi:formate-dependent nitrite reductase membrane component NrfD